MHGGDKNISPLHASVNSLTLLSSQLNCVGGGVEGRRGRGKGHSPRRAGQGVVLPWPTRAIEHPG